MCNTSVRIEGGVYDQVVQSVDLVQVEGGAAAPCRELQEVCVHRDH